MSLPEWVGAQAIDASDGSDLTADAVLTVAFDGGAFGAPDNAPAHAGDGYWRVQLSPAERAADLCEVKVTHASGITDVRAYVARQVDVVAWAGEVAAVKVGATSNLPQIDVEAWQDRPLGGTNMTEDDGGGATRWTAKALENAPLNPSGGGSTIEAVFRFNTGTGAADPGTGRVAFDDADFALVTMLHISEVSQGNFNLTEVYEDLVPGDHVNFARSNDGAQFVRYNVTGSAVDQGAWWAIPVEYIEHAGSFTNNQELRTAFVLDRGLTESEIAQMRYRLNMDGPRTPPSEIPGAPDASLTEIGGDPQSAVDLKDFVDAGYDPATGQVEAVKLVDVTAVNADMRGTDGASTHTPAQVAAEIGARDAGEGETYDQILRASAANVAGDTEGAAGPTFKIYDRGGIGGGQTLVEGTVDGDGNRTVTKRSF